MHNLSFAKRESAIYLGDISSASPSFFLSFSRIFLPSIFLDFVERDGAHVEINSAVTYHMTLDSACHMMSQTNIESPGRSVVRKVFGTCTWQQTGKKLSINSKYMYYGLSSFYHVRKRIYDSYFSL